MRVGVVGAGLSGLSAARELVDAGQEVVLFDKGRRPGGRMATRRIGAATLDHGAQFFTVRSETFARRVAGWARNDLVDVWCLGFGTPDGHPRYRATGGMNRLTAHLARGLDVRTSSLVFRLERREHSWAIGLDDATALEVDAAILTCPVPQAISLAVTGAVELPLDLLEMDYDRTLALLAVLDRPSAVPAPGGVQLPDQTFGFIGDNHAKGVSGVPAVTFHARAEWSLAWWDRDRDATHRELRRRAERWLGGAVVVESQVKRWRFATPQRTWPERCWVASDVPAPLVIAGDAFAGPKVEGAVLSGLAAAAAVLNGRPPEG